MAEASLSKTNSQDSSNTSADPESSPRVRVVIDEADLSYDTIKAAIYAQARYLFDKGVSIRTLSLSKALYEILNRRLVFKTAAQTNDRASAEERSSSDDRSSVDLPHFITPFGNLSVQKMDDRSYLNAAENEDSALLSGHPRDLSFIIEG